MGRGTNTISLTIGIICRNGEAFIGHALKAADELAQGRENGHSHIILVDSASEDSTGKQMQDFARSRDYARFLVMSGNVNAAAARNVILDAVRKNKDLNANPTTLFLVDGDIAIEPEFVRVAFEEFEKGNAEVIYGQLPEIWHDSQGQVYDTLSDRYMAAKRGYVKWFFGSVLLGPEVVSSRLRFDETYRRLEDIEFSLRVVEQFRILALPISMGTHYTDNYHSTYRFPDFVKQQYLRPAGQLFRDNWNKPQRLLTIIRCCIGHLIGLVVQLIIIIGAVMQWRMVLIAGLVLLIADFSRFVLQKRAHAFLSLRIVGAWQIIMGLLFPEKGAGPYKVEPEV